MKVYSAINLPLLALLDRQATQYRGLHDSLSPEISNLRSQCLQILRQQKLFFSAKYDWLSVKLQVGQTIEKLL